MGQELITKEEAIAKKLVKYFTGLPCKNNHIDFRYTNTGICYSCKRKRNKVCNSNNPKTAKDIWNRTYSKNKSKHLERSIKWAKKNPEKRKVIHDKNKLKYIDRYRKNASIRDQQKRKNDPLFRLNRNISKEIWAFLNGKKQGKTWKSFVKYDINELKALLESKFSDKMNWDNYGTYWELDHIIPLYFFKDLPLEESIVKAWDLSNLQPLEIYLNRSKQNKNKMTREELIKERNILESLNERITNCKATETY